MFSRCLFAALLRALPISRLNVAAERGDKQKWALRLTLGHNTAASVGLRGDNRLQNCTSICVLSL